MLLVILSFLLTLTFWLWIILKYDKFEREPLRSVLLVLVLGGFMSSVPAGILNQVVSWLIDPSAWNEADRLSLTGNSSLYYAFVGLNEETLKAVATIILVRSMKGYNEPADALVYAMTVALGFAVIENIAYSFKFGLATLFIRQFNAVPLHIGLAAIWGVGIARAKFIRQGRYFITVVPYVLLAALIHSVYNSITLFINPLFVLITCSVIALLLIRSAIKKVALYSREGPFANRLFCHHCHTVNFPDEKVCKNCGRKFSMEFYVLCNNCNAKVSKTASSCPRCGLKPNPTGEA
jgi:RsiW-degrading membrane proteinase PrsW (M82 family)/RNA polymerase subunit RPABC4/transcription elongation factor Spt4